ncbi:hypothetical protein [Roseobacter sp. OBYS 0001]|uniref:hypothetical protein n=1 Tax=Roseobacter sp. OBYS 0001 TaxID=882651 RepID=UPI001BC104DA|nr:hypothetical protein [Roseobacter sp. OBYS 0001]GIT85022.1 hypothetical protein ROBYS_00380 [Roseobacter sp. OBYS 0001]
MSKPKWLKKYTKLEYLPEILETRQLHLGDPKSWDDQNDAAAILMFSQRQSGFDIRGTCLTAAPDRFHFWHIFGERELGVCLWFDRERIVREFDQDHSLVSGMVRYPTRKDLFQTKPDEIAFTKREQYGDEREFRVLRVSPPVRGEPEKLKFSAYSLRRVYLNPWLSPSSVSLYKKLLRQELTGDLVHVELKQNRSLKKKDWINALAVSAGANL